MGLSKNEQIAFISGQKPALKAYRLGYYQDDNYKHKARPNPYMND
jgi:type IV secretory pathway TraG/TraD family ATPase VirD4